MMELDEVMATLWIFANDRNSGCKICPKRHDCNRIGCEVAWLAADALSKFWRNLPMTRAD